MKALFRPLAARLSRATCLDYPGALGHRYGAAAHEPCRA